MRIVQVSHTAVDRRGGVESYLAATLPGLVRAGHEVVHVHGAHDPRPELERIDGWAGEGEERFRTVAIHRDDVYFAMHSRLWHPGVGALWSGLLDELRPDLVHVHHWVHLTYDLVARAVAAGVPAVVTLHDAWTTCPRAFRVDRDGRSCRRSLGPADCGPCVPRFGHETDAEQARTIDLHEAWCSRELRAASRVVVASAATADLVAENLDIARGRLVELPLTAGFEGAPPPAAEPMADGVFRFAWWGVAAPHKGTLDVLEAFDRLCARGPSVPVRLDVFGPCVDDAVDERVRELGAAGRAVEMRGPFERSDLAAAGIDAAVLPSRAFETWSYAADEAIALDLPLIVSRFGVPARRLGNAVLAVPPDDVDALAAAMGRVVEDAGLRGRLAEARRALRGREPFPHVGGLVRLYDDVVREGPRRPEGDDRRILAEQAELLRLQRESAVARVLPAEGPG